MSTRFFRIEELVSRDLFNQYKNKPHYLWGLFDDRLLITLDRLRERYGKCQINNWVWEGSFQYSGFREPVCKIGAALSQHRFGRAADLKFSDISPEAIRKDIKSNPEHKAFELIRCVEEDTPTWLHIDVRYHTGKGILWVPM